MTDEQRRSADNGIWVCQNHGKLIDNDATRYSERLLRKWKRDAEQAAQRELEQPGHRQPGVAPRPSRPWMVFVRSRGAILRHGPGGPPIFFVAQLWFRNEPTSGSPIAESLAGFVTFLQNGIPLFPELRAEWAITNAAGNVAFSQSDETLERLLPVGDIAKLIVMHKRTQDGTAYAWSRGAVEYDGRRHPAHRIEAGQYRLRVRLRGIRVDQIFEFSVSNPGVGANPVIEPTKQSDAVVDDEASAR